MVSLSQSYFKIYNPSSGLLVFNVDPQNFTYIEDILNHQRKFFEDIKTDIKILRIIGYYPRHVKVLGWPDTIILIPRVEVINDTQRTHIILPDFLIKYRMHSVKSFTLATIEITEYDYITEESIPQSIQIVACGTSYHAGLVAKNWIEEYLSIPCLVDIASEYRYKKNIVLPNCLFITISQSGETADTLAALRLAKTLGYLGSLAICNVDGSSLVRESDLSFMTRAGAEIGVASTKAFIAQLVSFLVLTGSMMSVRTPNNDNENFPNIISNLISDLRALPYRIEETLKCAPSIENMAQILTNKTNAIFLGRGWLYPIAMEGALKLKEISYIHAEAYAAGELKHGPVALIDSDMPVICVTPSNKLLDKIISNIQVVKARKGETFIVSDNESQVENIIPVSESNHILQISKVSDLVAPIVFTIPLQLLSYYVALLRGYDVDQPRNLAKSVTVE